jgi:hypothetical protein
LNKKSAQKQKRLRNNGFSQAVVPQKTIVTKKDKAKIKHQKNRNSPTRKGLFFILSFIEKM